MNDAAGVSRAALLHPAFLGGIDSYFPWKSDWGKKPTQKQSLQLAFKKTNPNTKQVNYEHFFVFGQNKTKQNYVQMIGMGCLQQSDKQTDR